MRNGASVRTIAILGAGIQGTCAALALAARGCRVDLFEQASQPVTQASLWNEGKIHLGLIYARDRSGRTADMMLRGALSFASGLRRLTGRGHPPGLASAPFRYVVHRTSQLSVDAVAAHFEAVAERYRAARSGTGLSYFDHDSDFVWERMVEREWRADYDERRSLAAFRTIELSVDPAVVAGMLRRAVAEQERIRFHPNRRVQRVAIGASGAPAVILDGDETIGPYDHVVNALWQNLLQVDAGAGLPPTRRWLHRYKLAIHIAGAAGPRPPSTSILLGEYGDVVDFGNGRHYLSWYPACKLGEWPDLQPPDLGAALSDATRHQAFAATMQALTAILPAVGALDLSQASVQVEGGYIFAWGSTGIADPDSELHGRSDIGIRSRERYHSIDTGKYGMAPYFAEQLAERICGEDRRAVRIRTLEAM